MTPTNRLAVVVIGRNEGSRIEACLKSVLDRGHYVMYVDSGSTDDSVARATALGVTSVELDRSLPSTAARARNAGPEFLRQHGVPAEFVQFVDGDCEVIAGWLEGAVHALHSDPELAAVCGRRRERYPSASIYNQLMDMEWDTPIGDAEACGGDALFRAAAFAAVGGFNPNLICGEEPELCLRLRRAGWRIRRIDGDMTLHDADMKRIAQWWSRSVRGGWGYAEGAMLHGSGPERYNVRQSRSVWFWGALLPLASLGLSLPTDGASLLALVGYPLLMARVALRRHEHGDSARSSVVYAFFVTLGKLPQAVGQIRYRLTRLLGRSPTLIEYKHLS